MESQEMRMGWYEGWDKTIMWVKNSSAYITCVVASAVEVDIIGVYTNAEIEYRRADSTIISIATRGWRLAPGVPSLCDTIRIRMTIITVDSTVVTTDSEYELRNTGREMLGGITCGVTSKPNVVIPRPESVYQLSFVKS
jgi:hypothetical protein